MSDWDYNGSTETGKSVPYNQAAITVSYSADIRGITNPNPLYPVPSTLSSNEVLNVYRGEPVFVLKTQPGRIKNVSNQNVPKSLPLAMAAVNGLGNLQDESDQLKDPQLAIGELEKNIQFVGMAKSDYDHSAQKNHGFLVQMAGYSQAVNNGTTNVCVGDVIMWDMPEIITGADDSFDRQSDGRGTGNRGRRSLILVPLDEFEKNHTLASIVKRMEVDGGTDLSKSTRTLASALQQADYVCARDTLDATIGAFVALLAYSKVNAPKLLSAAITNGDYAGLIQHLAGADRKQVAKYLASHQDYQQTIAAQDTQSRPDAARILSKLSDAGVIDVLSRPLMEWRHVVDQHKIGKAVTPAKPKENFDLLISTS